VVRLQWELLKPATLQTHRRVYSPRCHRRIPRCQEVAAVVPVKLKLRWALGGAMCVSRRRARVVRLDVVSLSSPGPSKGVSSTILNNLLPDFLSDQGWKFHSLSANDTRVPRLHPPFLLLGQEEVCLDCVWCHHPLKRPPVNIANDFFEFHLVCCSFLPGSSEQQMNSGLVSMHSLSA
jgi:hypothetical protein